MTGGSEGLRKPHPKLSQVRRMQNMMSQRRWRQRKRREKEREVAPAMNLIAMARAEENKDEHLSIGQGQSVSSVVSEQSSDPQSLPSSKSSQYDEVTATDVIEALTLSGEEYGGQRKDEARSSKGKELSIRLQKLSVSQLLSISYCAPSYSREIRFPCVHFIKAFITNTKRMGMDIAFVCDPQSVSYISAEWSKHLKEFDHDAEALHNVIDKTTTKQRPEYLSRTTTSSSSHSTMQTSLRWDRIPSNMHPVKEQLEIEHHPYIDVAFPWPSVRAKVLRSLHNIIDYNDLCDSIFKSGLLNDDPAFRVWSDDAMDPAGWEVGETFARRWWFLFDDEIIRRTNWWRRIKGLLQLSNGKDDCMMHEWLET